MTAQVYTVLVIVVSLITLLVSFFVHFATAKKRYNKILESDINLDQMIEQEKKIIEFLDNNNLKPGADIQEIAKALKIIEGGVNAELQEKAKLTEKNIVYFKVSENKEDQLFDFAHECGHRINGDPVPATRPEGFNKSEIEQLADYTGAALLMPIESVYSFLVECQYRNLKKSKRIAKIRELSSRYEVSEIHVMRRIQEIYLIKDNQN